MQLSPTTLTALAQQLMAERKRQGLTREQAASVCNVSVSFIRDAETAPGGCSVAKLLQLVQGLGLTVAVTGWQPSDTPATPPASKGAE
jgi:transcriptional regulator with XRE-family HTH domain